ncbi:unnamed protein product, partial [Mesorhabditis spiculigera]
MTVLLRMITMDLVVHYGSLLRVRTSTWGVFEWYWYIRDGPIPLIIGLFVEYSILFQVLGTLLIAVNRATSMAMPHKYEKIWGFYTWHFIGGTAVIPLLYCIPSFTASSFFARFGWGYYIPYTLQNNSIGQFFDDVYFPICVAIVALTLLVNAYTGIKLFAYTKKLKKRELTFHIATLGQFIAQLINTAELILVNTLNINEYYMVFQFQPVCADIANFMPLWFLLLISEETRKMVTGKLTKADMNTTMTAGVSVVDSGKQNWGSQRRIQPNSRSMYGNKE